MFTKAHSRHRESAGTLPETVFAIGIGAVLLMVFISFAVYQGRSFTVLTNMVDLDQGNRTALDRLTRDIRQASRVTAWTTNSVTLEDWDGQALSFDFSPGAGTLTRTKGADVSVVLSGCDDLTFSMYQRNIIAGSYAYYPAATLPECKVVGMVWTCSRKILGKTSNVSTAQSARIVIRKA